MNHKDQIKDLAMIVNDGLTAYIVIHAAIFEEAAGVKSFLKNLVGRGMPIPKLLEESERLVPLWEGIHQKIEVFRHSSYSSLSKDERYYFDILTRYVNAIRKTVVALVDRQRLLNEGSKGGSSNPMTWEACQQKESVYQTAVQEYMAVGQELNAAGSVIFG